VGDVSHKLAGAFVPLKVREFKDHRFRAGLPHKKLRQVRPYLVAFLFRSIGNGDVPQEDEMFIQPIKFIRH
jgi:hypothetical protein